MEKGHRRAWRTLHQIARQEGVSVGYVARSIEKAVEEAYRSAKKRNDTQTIAMWERICANGKLPSAVEIIEYLSKRYIEDGMIS